MKQTREFTGKTVEEAREIALKELDADPGEVEVEIITRGKTGFLGIGNELARVRVRHLGTANVSASTAIGVINKILSCTGVETMTTLRTAEDPDVGGPVIDVTGQDGGLLIGRRGETLRALQYLVNLITNNKLGDQRTRIALDVEHYMERRQKSLKDMALRIAHKVAQSGYAITLEPMSPAERRIIHITLVDHPHVATESSGVRDSRKVTIMPQ